MSGYATAQNILHTGYFWPSLFKDCITAVQKCHNCQIFYRKMCAPPASLHPIIAIGPFAKWGIDFITCNPHSAGGHAYIILAVDYFTKWAEAMPTFSADRKTTAIFVFNHIIARFGVPQVIITGHGSHFRNIMMTKLTDQRGLRHDSSTPYYPQANATSKEEKCLLYLAQLDENRRNVALAIEIHTKRIKAQYDRNVTPRNFSKGDLVLLYDQANDKLGASKFVPMWHGLYIVKRKLAKGVYELEDFDGVSLGKPRNGLYLKRYYA
eukprot:PITA_02396